MSQIENGQYVYLLEVVRNDASCKWRAHRFAEEGRDVETVLYSSTVKNNAMFHYLVKHIDRLI